MNSKNLIHIKFEYWEAVQSKKDLLSSEMSLLRIGRKINKYHSFRNKELKLKVKLHKKVKEIKTSLNKLHTILPKIKIPEILQDEETGELKTEEPKKEIYNKDIENQLKNIQNKLRSLGQTNNF
jgi:hypothetical protein